MVLKIWIQEPGRVSCRIFLLRRLPQRQNPLIRGLIRRLAVAPVWITIDFDRHTMGWKISKKSKNYNQCFLQDFSPWRLPQCQKSKPSNTGPHPYAGPGQLRSASVDYNGFWWTHNGVAGFKGLMQHCSALRCRHQCNLHITGSLN